MPEWGVNIDIYDSTTNTIVANIPHRQTANSAGNPNFISAVLLPDGTVLCVPANATNFVIVDPVALTCTTGIPHSLSPTGTIPAFSGAVLGQDDLVYLAPGVDPRLQVYNYTTATLTPKAAIVGSTPASRPYSSPILLPNGDILMLQWKTGYNCARYRPSTNSVVASPVAPVRLAGGILSPDGTQVVLIADGANIQRLYDISTDTIYGTTFQWDQSASGAALMMDGRIMLVPGNSQLINALSLPVSGTIYTSIASLASVATLRNISGDGAVLGADNGPNNVYNTNGVVHLGDGSYLLLTTGAWKSTLLKYTPVTGGDPVPSELGLTRYFNRKV